MNSEFGILPEGVSKEDFGRAINEFRAVLGNDSVVVTPEGMTSYSKIMLPVDDDAHKPSGAVVPHSVEEVRHILAICNKYRVPVWPISTGKNLGYGSAAPATPGQVVMDLRRMNRILEVDADLCTALVEPGVTYQQLHDHISERNLPLWLSCPAPSSCPSLHSPFFPPRPSRWTSPSSVLIGRPTTSKTAGEAAPVSAGATGCSSSSPVPTTKR